MPEDVDVVVTIRSLHLVPNSECVQELVHRNAKLQTDNEMPNCRQITKPRDVRKVKVKLLYSNFEMSKGLQRL